MKKNTTKSVPVRFRGDLAMRRALLRLAGERQESLSVILREAVRQYCDRQLRPTRR